MKMLKICLALLALSLLGHVQAIPSSRGTTTPDLSDQRGAPEIETLSRQIQDTLKLKTESQLLIDNIDKEIIGYINNAIKMIRGEAGDIAEEEISLLKHVLENALETATEVGNIFTVRKLTSLKDVDIHVDLPKLREIAQQNEQSLILHFLKENN